MNTPSALWICFALDREARPLRPHLPKLNHARILVTGMGARTTQETLEQALALAQPRWLLTCGFAGGLSATARIGDVLFDTADPAMSDVLTHCGARPGSFHCASRVAVTVQEKRQLAEKTRADAVEMESAVIRRLCSARGIASATLRAISDTAEEDLPLDFNQLTGPDEQLSGGKLAAAILRRPWLIPRLMKLGRNSSLAADRLTRCILAAAPRLT